jgi:hypothetical protein
MTDETRARFLAGIATHLPPDRVIEVHLFGAMRQGGMESGVAVVAVDPAVMDREVAEPLTNDDLRPDSQSGEVDQLEMAPLTDAEDSVQSTQPAPRFTIYTARYRHTLKGIDRGKWELSVTEEADAPLLTVDAVVRGVSRRSGDTGDTARLSGDEFRAALPEPART